MTVEFLQVILCNKGDIDAVYNLVPSSTQFGSQFTFSPAQGIVMPGGYQAIQVKISFLFYYILVHYFWFWLPEIQSFYITSGIFWNKLYVYKSTKCVDRPYVCFMIKEGQKLFVGVSIRKNVCIRWWPWHHLKVICWVQSFNLCSSSY